MITMRRYKQGNVRFLLCFEITEKLPQCTMITVRRYKQGDVSKLRVKSTGKLPQCTMITMRSYK